MQRRLFLAHAGSAAMLAGAWRPAVSLAREAETPLAVSQLAANLWQISGAGGNVTVFRSSEGVLLVDGGAAADSKRLLAEVQKLTGTTRVHTLFNTHWHHDQTGSNEILGKTGTRIIAHENTRLWLTTDVISKWEGRVYQPLSKIAQPNETFYTEASLSFGGETIDYGQLGQAHTDGDIYVYFRKANVLVAADVAAAGAFPIIDYCTNGWIGGMVSAVQTLTELANDNTKVVAGKGAPLSLGQLKAEHSMLNTLKQRLSRMIAQGKGAEEMIAERPAKEFEAEWGDPTLLIRNCYPGMANRARELGVSIV
jgi:glyoxylase-like metal-dependent hydrolase (beta-lactamase superfamily II)